MEISEIEKVPIGGIVRHYKGNLYKILHIGRHSENLSLYVVYQGLKDCEQFGPTPIWIRPLEMFLETVEIDGKMLPRFAQVFDE